MNESDPLAQLRDIYLPADPGWWPPAVGWWLVSVVSIILLVVVVRWVFSQIRLRQAGRIARKMLSGIELQYRQHGDVQRTVKELSILLRRHALAVDRKEHVAGLSGMQWLLYLDQKINSNQFSEGVGKALLSAPYSTKTDINLEDLFVLIRKLFSASKRSKDWEAYR